MERGEVVEGGRNSVNRGQESAWSSSKRRLLEPLPPLPLLEIVPVSVLETYSFNKVETDLRFPLFSPVYHYNNSNDS